MADINQAKAFGRGVIPAPLFLDRADEAAWHQREGAHYYANAKSLDRLGVYGIARWTMNMASWHYRRARELMGIEP